MVIIKRCGKCCSPTYVSWHANSVIGVINTQNYFESVFMCARHALLPLNSEVLWKWCQKDTRSRCFNTYAPPEASQFWRAFVQFVCSQKSRSRPWPFHMNEYSEANVVVVCSAESLLVCFVITCHVLLYAMNSRMIVAKMSKLWSKWKKNQRWFDNTVEESLVMGGGSRWEFFVCACRWAF